MKVALAASSASEGAVHSQVRRGMAEGLTPEEIAHVALLAIPTLGLPGALRTLTWIDDIVKEQPKPKKKKGGRRK